MYQINHVLDLNDDALKYFEERCRPDHNHEKNSQLMTYGNDLYSDSGFLNDTESLYDVCKQDDEYVKNILGEDGHNIIARALISIICNSPKFKEDYPEMFCDIDTSKYEVKKETWLGTQYCPFVDESTWKCGNSRLPQFGGTDFEITNKKTGEVLKVSLLHVHLIYYHHFYEGNVEYRLSPESIINFFGLVGEKQEVGKIKKMKKMKDKLMKIKQYI
jgi:hypothetical protein